MTEIESLVVTASAAPKINLAMQQNACPVIRELTIENKGDLELIDIMLTMESDPPIVRSKTWRIAQLAPGNLIHLGDLKVDLVADALARRAEAVRGHLAFKATVSGIVANETVLDVDVLAHNEWGGIRDLPEIIAAFVQPNTPQVDELLRKAAEILRTATGEASLDGYQSGSPRRVAMIVDAIYRVIGARQIAYVNPPAHFETTGQKIRLVSNVLETGLGACLDLSVLFVACLEQAGLHPVIVMTEGHAFPGCWLVDEDFSQVVIDDVQALRKRVDLGQLIVFESTLLTRTPLPSFRLARDEAKRQIDIRGDGRPFDGQSHFQLAVDIKRARMSGIRPLSEANSREIARGLSSVGPEEPLTAGLVTGADDIPDLSDAGVSPSEVDLTDRLARWQRKLLDLSLRNKLLNFRSSKRTIKPVCYRPGKLEDLLADGKTFKLLPVPANMQNEKRDFSLYREQHGQDAVVSYVDQRLEKGELVFERDKDELESALVDLYRAGRNALQDGGANELFLALGFLHWVPGGKTDRVCKAPLILLPIELKRKSVKSGFTLQSHEDEPRFNPTLIEMLRQDFDIDLQVLGAALPVDEHGLDVAGIWHRVREAVRDIAGWEVREDLVISTFSFAKHLMWHDLVVRTDSLRENRAVAHLLDTPKEGYVRDDDPDPLQPEQLDRERLPVQTFCPLPADSSQLAAIMNAASGRDFVLIGPPGTGKSQTIANLIAQCLAEQKTVLFVSEKTAALDVVYRRLRQVGLGPLCLELHSHKTRKTEVLAQLDEAWTTRRTLDDAVWKRECDRLLAHRETLNKTATHLHRRHPNGWSAFEAIGEIVNNDAVPRAAFAWPTHAAHAESDYLALEDIAKRLDVNRAELGELHEHPLAAICQTEWSPSWQQDFSRNAGRLARGAEQLRQVTSDFLKALQLQLDTLSYGQIEALEQLYDLFLDGANLPLIWSFGKGWKPLRDKVKRMIDEVGKFQRAWGKLETPYQRSVLSLDIAPLAADYAAYQNEWWLKRVFGERRVTKTLRRHIPGRKAPNDLNVEFAPLLEAKLSAEAVEQFQDLAPTIGFEWCSVDTDPAFLEQMLAWPSRYRQILSRLTTDQAVLTEIHRRVFSLIRDFDVRLDPDSVLMAKGLRFKNTRSDYEADLRAMAETAASEARQLIDHSDSDYLVRVCAIAEAWQGQERKLRTWCAWRAARREAVHTGLTSVVELFETGANGGFNGLKVLRTNYARWWLDALVDQDDILRRFVPVEHEQLVDEFAELDERHRQLTADYIHTKLSQGIPGRQQVGRDSDWAVLQRELNKKARHMPVRELVSRLPEALTKLTPCVMMSPLSIAQYLPADGSRFDIVVFDEASQITPWDAIGAFARGQQVIVVGDPKQLPPTSFFDRRADEDADESYGVDDMESILDECMAANMPTLDLRWHYRSAHESLIAFSNKRYYGGRLVTFPSPATQDRAVSFYPIEEGGYDRGGSRTNRLEADAIIADIVGCLRQPDFRDTIGVVTFNSEQQKLIEDLLDKARAEYPEIEPHFGEDRTESVFVKNLESVQGDERDVIYFSITYGPDQTGKLMMNFGPINQAGGPRRLNVAVTRARKSMKVFSSLSADKIDLSRSDKEGVRDLKHFLEYAERGNALLSEADGTSRGGFDSPFEEAIFRALEAKGWRLIPQVGVSDYRVDLGVVHPDYSGRFLAAVECDGATYHRSATARDRDLLREQVLRRLGWEVVRIWSLDWWADPQTALDRVHRRLTELLENDQRLAIVAGPSSGDRDRTEPQAE